MTETLSKDLAGRIEHYNKLADSYGKDGVKRTYRLVADELFALLKQHAVAEPQLAGRIWCHECGKSVSTPVPKDTIVRAWVQCPECIEKKAAEQPTREELLEQVEFLKGELKAVETKAGIENVFQQGMAQGRAEPPKLTGEQCALAYKEEYEKFHRSDLSFADLWQAFAEHLNALLTAPVAFPPRRPKVVCLCGSTRFYENFQRANYEETMAGRIVLSVGFYPHAQKEVHHSEDVGCTAEQKIALDELHKRKIDLADEVFVLNVGGYIGSSTRSEIEYAQKTGKPIRYLEPSLAPGEQPPSQSGQRKETTNE